MKVISGFLGLLLLLGACSNCASRNINVTPPLPPMNDTGVTLFTPVGFGHGCPVDGVIFTARHVVEPVAGRGTYSAWWGDYLGNDGLARLVSYSEAVDIAILKPQGVPPEMVERGEPTEHLYFFNYDYVNALDSLGVRAKLLRETAGHIIMDVRPVEGASGGCIFNDKGQAVGIVVWGLDANEKVSFGIGVRLPKGE